MHLLILFKIRFTLLFYIGRPIVGSVDDVVLCAGAKAGVQAGAPAGV